MTIEQILINSKVAKDGIRREHYNGREHFVVSSKTLPFNVVMNDGLYPENSIVANYQSLEGTLAPLGHPVVNGKYVSAFSAEGINAFHVGAWNRNVTLEGNRVSIEKWIDIDVANKSDSGKRLIERLVNIEQGKGEPISTSVAAMVEKVPADGKDGYSWVANIKQFDHDAILLDEAPAASTDQGVGMMVNCEDAVAFKVNEQVFGKKTARQRDEEMNRAVKDKFQQGERWAYPIVFTDDQVIVQIDNQKPMVYGYTVDNGKIEIDNTGKPVESKTIWQVVANALKAINPFHQTQAAPAITMEANEMAMTPEEQKALTEQISQSLAANMAAALKPLQDQVAAIEANQKQVADALQANANAEVDGMRKVVAEKHGLSEVVANSLSPDAVREMHSKLGDAATLAANAAQGQSTQFTVPDVKNYFN